MVHIHQDHTPTTINIQVAGRCLSPSSGTVNWNPTNCTNSCDTYDHLKNECRQVSRYAGTDALLQSPPKPVSVNESFRLLLQDCEIHETVLAELRPLVRTTVAPAAGRGSSSSECPENTVVVMVCNAGPATALPNFVCAARGCYFNEKLFASVPSQGTVEKGTME